MELWQWLKSDNGGNIAEWVGGIGTTVALLIAALPLARDRKRLARYQGEAIYLVTDKQETYPYTGRLRVRNESDLPAYQVQIIGLNHRQQMTSGERFRIRKYPPKYRRVVLEGTPRHDSVLPCIDPRSTVKLEEGEMHGTDEFSFLLTFIDAKGKRWLKHYYKVAPEFWSTRKWPKIEAKFFEQNMWESTTTVTADGAEVTEERWYDSTEQ